MKLTGAQIIIESLIGQNVDTVFGYPGGAVLNIYDELYKRSGEINHVISAHEQGAAHAADGYARVTGKAGVVIATSGPGATNLVTGIANAYLDSIPLVAITGNVTTELLGKDSFQEVDIIGITMPVVKHSFMVRDVTKLASTISEAFFIAKTGRPGPVLIDVPKDIQIQSCEYKNDWATPENSAVSPGEASLAKAAAMISQMERPYIYCGGGVISSSAFSEVIDLSKRIDAPIGTSMMGLCAVPASYEYNLGMAGMHGRYASSKAKSEADLIIAVGARFSDRATGNKQEYTKNAKFIHIDIDPAEIDKNILTHIALTGDVKTTLRRLIKLLEKKQNPAWRKAISDYRRIEESKPWSGTLTPEQIIRAVNACSDGSTVVATDVGQHQMWVAQHYKFERPRTHLTSGGLGTMGYGLGAAIGGCFGCGKKKTVLFTGDGSFGMNLNELATAVSQNLPLVIIIMNNGVLGMVRQWQASFYEKRYSNTTLNRKTDFVKLAEAFGAAGMRVSKEDELSDALETAFKAEGPVVIDCVIDRDERVLPMIPPGGSIKNIITK